VPSEAITLESLSVSRRAATGESRRVLRSVDASFAAGELTVVRGPTGAGKTSLLHVMGGLLRPTSGQIRYGDQVVSRLVGHHRELWRRQVGMAFQRPELFADLSVLENVMVPFVVRAGSLSELRTQAARAVDRLSLSSLAGRPAAELSVGEQQRVGLARAIIADPPILLADEPTAHQDAEAVTMVMTVLERAKLRGGLVVVTSHDPRVVDGPWSDRRWELRQGALAPDSE
jgi:putative ABC transport system ATP-binding protein